jgi:patatin-like phospholipase/acyl hydrolase
MTTPADSPSPAAYRLLALSGGGFLGLYTAEVLSGLEGRARAPLGRSFDLLAGTSIGAILALALAFEIPMARIVQLFVEHGGEVFSEHGLPTGAVRRLLDLTRSVLGPKYSGEALRSLLEAEFGDARLGQARHAVVVPAVDVERSRTKIFKSPRPGRPERDSDCRVVDVAMAACAAPAYFPSVAIAGHLYADGGLFAVAPDQLAMHEAQHFRDVEPARMRMLSIGTAAAHYRPAQAIDANAGAVGWLSDGRLLLTLLSAQQQHVCAMMEDRLGERFLRLDAPWDPAAGLGLDVATPLACKHLMEAARKTLDATRRARIDRLLQPPRAFDV